MPNNPIMHVGLNGTSRWTWQITQDGRTVTAGSADTFEIAQACGDAAMSVIQSESNEPDEEKAPAHWQSLYLYLTKHGKLDGWQWALHEATDWEYLELEGWQPSAFKSIDSGKTDFITEAIIAANDAYLKAHAD